MADTAPQNRKPAEEIDLTPDDEVLLDMIWDELNRQWTEEEQKKKEEQPNGRQPQ